VVCAAMLVLGVPASAGALAPNTWGPASPLPSGTTSLGDQILSSPTGALMRYSVSGNRPSLATFGPDGLGPATAIPSAPAGALPGPVAFLPDGSAVISYYQFYTGPLRLVVRAANGTFGPAYNLTSGAQSFAARDGEVLVLGAAFFNVKQVTASSLSIGPGGTLTPVGGAAVIYTAPGNPPDLYGTQISAPVAGLDTNGEADAVITVDHVSTSGDEVLEMHRSAAGAWGAPQSLSAGLPGAAFASEPKAAVAPGGRTLIAFNTGDGSLTKSTLWRSLREPGSTFPAPSLVNDLSGVGGAINTTLAAAGGDGTLALGVFALTCQSISSEVKLETLRALVAPPGGPLGSYSANVLDSAADQSRMISLGAGHGEAIFGLTDQQVTGGNADNVCQSVITNGQAGTISDRVSIVGPDGSSDHTFGSGTYDGNGNGSVVLSADAVGLNATGDGAITGRLAASGVPASAFYQGPPPVPVAPPTPTPAGTPAPAPSPPAPANTSSPTPRSGPLTLNGSGVVSFTLTAPTFSNPRDVLAVNILLQVFSGNGSSASVQAAKKKPKKPRLIGVVRKSVRLHSGQKLVTKLTLTRKLRTYLKQHPAAVVKLQLTSTQTGRKKTVKTLAVRLKHKG
jgi:hypothetical protein